MVNTLLMIKDPAAGFPTGVENMGSGEGGSSQFDGGGLSQNMEGA